MWMNHFPFIVNFFKYKRHRIIFQFHGISIFEKSINISSRSFIVKFDPEDERHSVYNRHAAKRKRREGYSENWIFKHEVGAIKLETISGSMEYWSVPRSPACIRLFIFPTFKEHSITPGNFSLGESLHIFQSRVDFTLNFIITDRVNSVNLILSR